MLREKLPKLSAISSGKTNKYEYLTGKEISPPEQSRIIEQATFTYSALGKASEKQTKTYKYLGEKQIKPTEDNKKTFKPY